MFVSYEPLPADWDEDAPSPVVPDLAIEITSPEQTFGARVAKATDYLAAGVIRVWIVDPKAKSITAFYPAAPPATFLGDQMLTDEHLEGLHLDIADVF